MTKPCSVITGLYRNLVEHPTRPALVLPEPTLTYCELGGIAQVIAAEVARHADVGDYVAVMGSRSRAMYAGILGITLAGRAYMPLNPRFPSERIRRMVAESQCRLFVVGQEAMEQFADILTPEGEPMIVLSLEDHERLRHLKEAFPQHEYVCLEGMLEAPVFDPTTPPPLVDRGDPAYLLFTSGSTGKPKGVVVNHGNLVDYVRHTISTYGFHAEDRFSQMFDSTFDLSVHDIFVSWSAGACLYSIPADQLMAPAKFIREHGLTVWFSVPSVGMFMEKMRLLRAGAFPSLRVSLFCGEALPARVAEAWQKASPNSVVENLYGPTEATIAFTRYRWNSETSPGSCRRGLAPLGWPFEGLSVRVGDVDGRALGPDETGELFLAGSQVTSGYLNDPVKTAGSFLSFDDSPAVTWYRTGDLVAQDEARCLYYVGRTDSQVQVRGYRVELSEIDTVLRDEAQSDFVVCVAWPLENGRSDGVYAFLEGSDDDVLRQRLLAKCQRILPDYMIPREFIFLAEIPLNVNGKMDRSKLYEMMGDRKANG